MYPTTGEFDSLPMFFSSFAASSLNFLFGTVMLWEETLDVEMFLNSIQVFFFLQKAARTSPFFKT